MAPASPRIPPVVQHRPRREPPTDPSDCGPSTALPSPHVHTQRRGEHQHVCGHYSNPGPRPPNPFCRLVADTSLAAVYGIDMSAKDGELYRMVDTMRGFVDPLLLPGGYLLEMFPSLQHLPSWLPGMHIKHIVEEGRELVRSTFHRLDRMWTVANVSSSYRGSAYCLVLTTPRGVLRSDSGWTSKRAAQGKPW